MRLTIVTTIIANPTNNMIPRPNYRVLVIVGFVQTMVLAIAWAFFGAVRASNPLYLPDHAAHWVHRNPTETTLIVTITATVLSVATGLCFSIAVKQALTQRIAKRPISLVKLSAGVAFAKSSFILKRSYVWLTIETLVVFGIFALLTSNWTTLLTPVQVTVPVQMSGWELDISSPNFDPSLREALDAALSSAQWLEVYGSGGLLAGIAAAGKSFGQDSIFNFNEVKYNVSTGGILPAVVSYNGTKRVAPLLNSSIDFSGGLVPANLTADGKVSGIFSTFAVSQQGLTANVTCTEYTTPVDSGGLSITQTPYNGELFTSYPFTLWYLQANCTNNGGTSAASFVTHPLDNQNGLLSSVVCPTFNNIANPNLNYTFDEILAFSNGTGLYSFLPPTVCSIVPMITNSTVVYANQIINTTVLESTPIEDWQQNLLLFLVDGIAYQAGQTQNLETNVLGDALFSIYTATTTSTLTNGDPTQIRQELAQFWRGVVEFSGTFLRSGFSAFPRTVSPDMLVSMKGTQTIFTIGWSATKPSYLYTLVPVTLTAFLTAAWRC
ncbi:hypothetical protein BS17DRAFT_148534 [Gyrodon lividus]|nr:hypothetical protein BS17DRAFT_148534 [Gyrodon lividus]